jgi:hypothetical protein
VRTRSTLSLSSVTFGAGDYTRVANFQPVTAGTDTISLVTLFGFATPANGQSITYIVRRWHRHHACALRRLSRYGLYTTVGNNPETTSPLYGFCGRLARWAAV